MQNGYHFSTRTESSGNLDSSTANHQYQVEDITHGTKMNGDNQNIYYLSTSGSNSSTLVDNSNEESEKFYKDDGINGMVYDTVNAYENGGQVGMYNTLSSSYNDDLSTPDLANNGFMNSMNRDGSAIMYNEIHSRNSRQNLNEVNGAYDNTSLNGVNQSENGADTGYFNQTDLQDQILKHVSSASSTTNNSMLPISTYKLQYDANPTVVKKILNERKMVYRQNINIRLLKPPQPPAPGPLIIREVRPPQIPPAPPLVIRQRPPRPPTPPPIILREKPPVPPTVPGPKVIKKQLPPLPPPPRQVIIERYPQLPPKPQDVIIERWLPYDKIPKRRVIYQKASQKPAYKPAKNMIVYYQAQLPIIQRFIKRQHVTRMNPKDYIQKYSNTLLDKNTIVEQVNRVGIVGDLANVVTRSISDNNDSIDLSNFTMQPYTSDMVLGEIYNAPESIDSSLGSDRRELYADIHEQIALSDYQQDIGKNQILDDYNQSEMFLAPRDSVELNRTDGNLVDSLNESILHGDNFVNESATNSMDMYHNIYNEQSKIDETNENMGSLRNAQYSNYDFQESSSS